MKTVNLKEHNVRLLVEGLYDKANLVLGLLKMTKALSMYSLPLEKWTFLEIMSLHLKYRSLTTKFDDI